MATTVRATCRRCGAVEVPVGATRLSVGLTAPGHANEVLFRCPGCGSDERQPIGERATRLLARAGIVLVAHSESPAVDMERGYY